MMLSLSNGDEMLAGFAEFEAETISFWIPAKRVLTIINQHKMSGAKKICIFYAFNSFVTHWYNSTSNFLIPKGN
jgi:hypothetical protein